MFQTSTIDTAGVILNQSAVPVAYRRAYREQTLVVRQPGVLKLLRVVQWLYYGVYPEFQTHEILLSAALYLHDWR